ncbi:MAG: lysophospholipid acyltransferase family protein [Verrucomicrobiota bacterium]
MKPWYRFGYIFTTIVSKTFFSFRVVHRERMLETGGAIVAMNHQSFFDPPLVGICSRRDIYFLARKSLFSWPVLGPIFPKLNNIPVDRDGSDMGALKTLIKLVRSGQGVALFPEGTRTRDGNLQTAKAGIGLVIAKTMAPVVPMRIFGAFEAFPRDRKLPKFHKITIVVGEPVYFTQADIGEGGREVYQKLSDRVMEAIAAIQYERP